MFKIIHNLYANAKSCVRVGHFKSELFCSNIGVRHGENLLTLLQDVSGISKLLLRSGVSSYTYYCNSKCLLSLL